MTEPTADDEREAQIREHWKSNGGYGRVVRDEATLLRRLDHTRVVLSGAQSDLAQAQERIEHLQGLLGKMTENERDEARGELNAIANTPPSADAMDAARNLLLELGCCFLNRRKPTVSVAAAIEAAEDRGKLKAHRAAAPAWEAINIARRMIRDAVQEIGPVGCVKEGDVGPPDPIGEAEAIIAGIQAIEAAAEARSAAQMRELADLAISGVLCRNRGEIEVLERAVMRIRALPLREAE